MSAAARHFGLSVSTINNARVRGTLDAVGTRSGKSAADSARAYFEAQRWPDGPVCPACRETKRIWDNPKRAGFYRCNADLLVFTVRTGTILEKSRVPLNKWLYAMHLLVTARKGISSVQLAKQIGVTQKTAWFMLARLRKAGGYELAKLAGIYKDRTIVDAVDAITARVLAYRPADKGRAAVKTKRRLAGVARPRPAEEETDNDQDHPRQQRRDRAWRG